MLDRHIGLGWLACLTSLVLGSCLCPGFFHLLLMGFGLVALSLFFLVTGLCALYLVIK